MFVIFDLDGTLADIEHRRHMISDGKKDWPGFFRACVDDAPIIPVLNTYSMFKHAGHRVEIWSGRSDIVQDASNTWLTTHLGEKTAVTRMRAERDYQPDDQLKESWLLSLEQKPDLVFDDRQKVVDMWRRHGIVCAQVAPGNF
ncbi:MAG: hypothetical protein AAF986_01350 [Pseudomonadota bacterium]